ncbi:DinB family protein [Paenibacillus sp. DMB20]|uniref:DinB family protein n=1 Tax=Paenibacillus sp. DMB20 TaxID=1642570 RepID=UPI0006280E95|nr:DinB family protein [Paenibacillus sp. DMB20]KKO53389.1 hypothetical protein XI25_13940 [Paenibacillus sp. DMB20]
MHNEKEQLLEKFGTWIDFVGSLERNSESVWDQPLAEGKWSVRGVVSHIMKWDEYFLNEAILKISRGEPLTSKHLDYDEFNEEARRYGESCPVSRLADETKRLRQELIRHIRSLSEDQYERAYTDGDGNPFELTAYLKDFIWHDEHHIVQISPLLE